MFKQLGIIYFIVLLCIYNGLKWETSCILYTGWSYQTIKMLIFGFILLVATSALAAPSYSSYDKVKLKIVGRDIVGPTPNSGRANHLIDGLSAMFDGGDTTVNTITFKKIGEDLASLKDKRAQSLALAQAISSSLAEATGIPGDVCISTEFINAYASGKYHQALRKYINHIAKNLSLLVTLKKNPEAARFTRGPTSGCREGGRIYKFEDAWDAILAKATPSTAGFLNEQYCTARRLYNAFDVRSNNIGTVVTAASLPPAADAFAYALGPLIDFLNALCFGRGSISQTMSLAQEALLSSVK